jgi:hypothetical protein
MVEFQRNISGVHCSAIAVFKEEFIPARLGLGRVQIWSSQERRDYNRRGGGEPQWGQSSVY